MLKKKECSRCGRKINEKYGFCPYCGNYFGKKSKEGDWGLLGRDDSLTEMNEMRFPAGFNAILNSLMRNLNKQFNEIDKQPKKSNKPFVKKSGVSINISTSGNEPPKIKVNYFGDKKNKQEAKKIKKIASKIFPQEKVKKFSNLPREEPKTNIKRLSNKIIYEIDIPNVDSIDDVSVIKLEESIEIRAIAKDKAYFKLIPINLPLINYNFSKGKLILELALQNSQNL